MGASSSHSGQKGLAPMGRSYRLRIYGLVRRAARPYLVESNLAVGPGLHDHTNVE